MSGFVGPGAIDWSRPWLAPWRHRGEALEAEAQRLGVVGALNAASALGTLSAASASTTFASVDLVSGMTPPAACPVSFVDHGDLPPGEPYEAFIARTACVPTRPNLHDFFNGLAWLVHPGLKRRLNRLQASAIAAAPRSAPRGAVRDALTLLDENAALLQAPPVLIDALEQRDWHALFVTHRAAWQDARLELFGHALLEKLVVPRQAITAHVWCVPEGVASLSDWLADSLGRHDAAVPSRLAPKPFAPLPVLGVPGWWAANEAPAFYDDTRVFRSGAHAPSAQKNSGPEAAG